MQPRISRTLKILAAAVFVVAVTFVVKAFSTVNATTVGFAYLITILLVAAWWGLAESVVASIVATVSFNYFFLPPVGTVVIEDPQNWIALLSFLICSLIASDLSNRARRRTAEANARKIEMERLYALSRAILTTDASQPVGDQIAMDLARICEIPAVTIYDGFSDLVYRSGGADELVDARLKETARTGSLSQDEQTGTVFSAISLGGSSTGSVALRGAVLSNAALHALLNLIAITLENARSREILTRSQAARQSEEFKSTLLDGLAHEFKTPLTSIKAATTALLASNVSDAAQRQELLTIVDQEAERLSSLVTEATRVARIEAGKIHVNRDWQSPTHLIQTVLAQMETQCDGRRVNVSLEPDLPAVFVDADLIQLALRQLIDNALKYSPRRSEIQISSRKAGDDVVIAVRNQGEPLSKTERVRIFDKFYRGQNVRRQAAGTGMGLPVARNILLAHGGDVQLRDSDERGTEFVIRIPLGDATEQRTADAEARK
jgi:two-component system, OmpR family, sensor histidine kinase KdpD